MISGVQTFGDLINFHPHIHALVPCGVFLKSGCFVPIDDIPSEKFLSLRIILRSGLPKSDTKIYH